MRQVGMSQVDVSELANCSKQAINHLLSGRSHGGRILTMVAQVLNVDPTWLAEGTGPAPAWYLPPVQANPPTLDLSAALLAAVQAQGQAIQSQAAELAAMRREMAAMRATIESKAGAPAPDPDPALRAELDALRAELHDIKHPKPRRLTAADMTPPPPRAPLPEMVPHDG